jgi:hypothetical protein
MLRALKQLSLRVLQTSGVFELTANSSWRRQRLLILCYHGISLDEEHAWRPDLYMRAEHLERRLQALRRRGCSVLPLDEAVGRLYTGSLPPRSVVLTFDDGCYDFFCQAFPLLKAYGFPATVYQTTYYCEHRHPVFHLICSYMLWKARGQVVQLDTLLGSNRLFDLSLETERDRLVSELIALADLRQLSADQRDLLARQLAATLGIDYQKLLSARILQLMRADEIREISTQDVNFQLHTHRHRTPCNADLFRKEIRDNRGWLEPRTGAPALHFCYPSGHHEGVFLPWLRQEEIISATTCEPGLASPKSNVLLLPRFVDTSAQPDVAFDSWLTGVAGWLPRRRPRPKSVNAAGVIVPTPQPR